MTTIDEFGNITATKGDTFNLVFTDVKINNVAVDWNGYSAKLIVKLNASSNPVLELDETSGIDLSINGQFTLNADAADMDFDPRTYFYDLEFTDGSGNVETWFNKKKFNLLEDLG